MSARLGDAFEALKAELHPGSKTNRSTVELLNKQSCVTLAALAFLAPRHSHGRLNPGIWPFLSPLTTVLVVNTLLSNHLSTSCRLWNCKLTCRSPVPHSLAVPLQRCHDACPPWKGLADPKPTCLPTHRRGRLLPRHLWVYTTRHSEITHTHTRTHARTPARTPARTHARTHAHHRSAPHPPVGSVPASISGRCRESGVPRPLWLRPMDHSATDHAMCPLTPPTSHPNGTFLLR
jgi:hypothetical protein